MGVLASWILLLSEDLMYLLYLLIKNIMVFSFTFWLRRCRFSVNFGQSVWCYVYDSERWEPCLVQICSEYIVLCTYHTKPRYVIVVVCPNSLSCPHTLWSQFILNLFFQPFIISNQSHIATKFLEKHENLTKTMTYDNPCFN